MSRLVALIVIIASFACFAGWVNGYTDRNGVYHEGYYRNDYSTSSSSTSSSTYKAKDYSDDSYGTTSRTTEKPRDDSYVSPYQRKDGTEVKGYWRSKKD